MAPHTTRRKPLTPEQQAAGQARRQAIYRLAQQISSMSPEARFDLALRSGIVTCEGHMLSPFNVCLVISQQADATIVGGFRQWKTSGRQVRKGAHGCAIFVPKQKTAEEEGGVPDDKRFLMVTVFDISMTEPVE